MTHTTGTPLIDWTAVRDGVLAEEPFGWCLIRDTFDPVTAAAIEEQFPSEGFVVTERPSGTPGAKGYRTHNLPLVTAGRLDERAASLLTPLWRALLDDLRSPEYRAAVTALTGRDVTGCELEIRAVRYPAGAWIDPHTDRADKVVTQTWYFNSDWCQEYRGQLLVLGSDDVTDVRTEVLPGAGDSVVLCPSENSWHAVAPVADRTPVDRRVLLLHFVRPGNAEPSPR
ncbi:2OG-Fe(II) oxygenase [Lentzea sp. NPDC034063]|uniref:2OG-Fe(II) oxygenase n=1 Tax=unclassified Lentzea TaxID=2643253 RepID=UPI0033FE2565